LQDVKKGSHVDAQTFVNDVWASLEEDAPYLIVGIDPNQIKDRLCKLVTQVEIQLTSVKIADLMNEVERSFWNARILTDVRTSFGSDASVKPSAASILHTLVIRYHDDLARHREFYVALDSADLSFLKALIERAEAKDKTLSDLLAKTDVQVYER
jgi:hypothetical protein